ncbi:hypothetical protein MMC13_002075 [Lambiella insularis]|nr:hypothetical protein [Lambiella insularis]
MPDTITTSSTGIPTISGTSSNKSVTILPSYVPHLVLIHAVLLVGSFLLLFPLGVIILRWFGKVKGHRIMQSFAAFFCTIGLAVAVVFSRVDREFSSFSKPHQIIGIVAVVALFAQAYFGYAHHLHFKKMGRRTTISHLHLWTGRLVVPLGMLNACLGFTLASQIPLGIGIAGISIAILTVTYLLSYCAARRDSKHKTLGQATSENIPLGPYNRLDTPRFSNVL